MSDPLPHLGTAPPRSPLVVDIPNAINLNIVAQSGPGNLLGNLLCGVTNLLNGGGALSQVASGLNQVLGRLGL
ncbi:MAG TPA: hypothetical protein VG498_04210 [Terriglobales bacterium]|nr:hypothetical protein [Terriglobales bacterium]